MVNSSAQDEYAPNFTLGVAAGLGAALLGAGLWAAITAITNFQIGFMAVGVGILVGYAVRTFGKGDDVSFGVAGAVLALVGCLLGNLLAADFVAARELHLPFFSLLFSPDMAVELMKATFSPMDLLFYGIAVYEGYKFSIYE